jgi:hypothetical protein
VPATIAESYLANPAEIRLGVVLALAGVFLSIWFLGYLGASALRRTTAAGSGPSCAPAARSASPACSRIWGFSSPPPTSRSPVLPRLHTRS